VPDYDDYSSLTGDERILAECRDRYDYARTQLEDIRSEGDMDMLYVSGNPWPEAEKLARKGTRPCMVMDEYSQYANQVINDVRQNKRAIQVEPEGFGANDQSAELVGDLFRNIEYESNAQSAYICGFENMLNRSEGGWIVRREYVSESSFDQKLTIDRIPNVNSSYPDPDCKKADYSDARYWFLLDKCPRKEYKRKYPKATIVDFTSEHYTLAPNWIKQDEVIVAEYWTVDEDTKTLYLVRIDNGQPAVMAEDELPDNFDIERESKPGGRILNEREAITRKVTQYITNGIEILETNPQPGKYIPIVWLTGKELYVNNGGAVKRILMSLVRPMRDPLMMVNYCATTKAEVIGMTPKTPWLGYTGQFHKPETWQASNLVPTAYLEANAKTDATGDAILPIPTRMSYSPEVQSLEMAQESARRSVQAAGGMSALPTNAQRLSEKSGKALEQIDANEDRGTFHFIDNFKQAIAHTGVIMEDLRRYVYDAPREVGVRNKKGEHRIVKINQKYTDDKGNEVTHDLKAGQNKITIGSGPSYESEREAASEFVDTIVPELEQIVADPVVKMKLAALLVKLKNIGPIGDEIVELLDPKAGPDQTQAQLAQATQQSQQYQQMVADLQTTVQRLELEKKAHVIDNEYKSAEADKDRKLKLDIAEITTKSQDQAARDRLTADLMSELHVAAHEAATTAVQHAHEKHLAAQSAAQSAQSQQSDQAHQTAMAAQSSPQPGSNGTGAGS
jgi:hypothetical protein